MPRLEHPHSADLFYEKRGTLEKLPPLRGEGASAHKIPSGYKTSSLRNIHEDGGRREMLLMKDWQQDFSLEKTWQNLDPIQKKYHSARTVRTISPGEQDCSIPLKKASKTIFPLKPVYHKRTYSLNNCQSKSDAATLKPSNPDRNYSDLHSPSQDYLGYDRRQEKKYLRDLCSYDRVSHQPTLENCRTNVRMFNGSQRLQGEQQRLIENQALLKKEIRKREMILQEKLLKTEEELRRIQKQRMLFRDKTEQEERNRRNTEKERRESRLQSEQGSWERGRRKANEEIRNVKRVDWQSNFKEDMNGLNEWEKETRERKRDDWRRGREEVDSERGNTEKASNWMKQNNGEWNRWERGSDKEDMERERTRRDRIQAERKFRSERNKKGEWDHLEREEKEITVEEWIRKERRRPDNDIQWEREEEKKIWEWKEKEKSNSARKETVLSTEDKGMNGGPVNNWYTERQHKLTQKQTKNRRGSSSSGSNRASSLPQSGQLRNQLQQVELSPEESSDTNVQLVPCPVCHRCFASNRLEKHCRVCKKLQCSNRKVFDSSKHRMKGTELEVFLRTNGRSKTPELKKNNWRQKHEAFLRNMRQALVPATGGQSSMDPNPDYVTCPHCGRRFAPAPAERHIPKCQNIKSRPPPVKHRS